MVTTVDGRDIERVAVVDDSEDMRQTLSDELSFAFHETHPLVGPFKNVNDLVTTVTSVADAAVCDHHLNTRNFAHCTGAEVVNRCYRQRFPSVLITNWGPADIDEIRPYLPGIPVLLTPNEANLDAIKEGFMRCMEEFRDEYRSNRKPWRTLVRVEDVSLERADSLVYVVLPGWISDQVIRLKLDIFPCELQPHIKPGARFHARVNLGAETQDQLYFSDFDYHGG